jgi:hypothetical protein
MPLTKSFEDFLNDEVNLNKTRVDTIKDGIDTMETFLKNDELFGPHFISVTPQGSFRQKTIIKPVQDDADFDADIIFEMEEVVGLPPKGYLDQLHNQFKKTDRYKDLVDRRGKTRCVTIDYASDFHIDIIPCIFKDGQYKIMNKKTDLFEDTDADGYARWFSAKNDLTNGKLVEVVRLVKYIRDTKELNVKSVVLTTILGALVSETDPKSLYSDLPTAFKNLFNRLDQFLQSSPNMPIIRNPALATETFNRHWDQDSYSTFREKVHTLNEKINNAFQSGHGWQNIFGDSFPTQGEDIVSKFIGKPEDFTDEYSEEEEYIEDLYKVVSTSFSIKLEILIDQSGSFRERRLSRLIFLNKRHSPTYRVIESNIPVQYSVLWKIKNSGPEARDLDKLRGEIHKDDGSKERSGEKALYSGVHYVEVYAIKDGVCVAKDRVYVKIP